MDPTGYTEDIIVLIGETNEIIKGIVRSGFIGADEIVTLDEATGGVIHIDIEALIKNIEEVEFMSAPCRLPPSPPTIRDQRPRCRRLIREPRFNITRPRNLRPLGAKRESRTRRSS